MPTGRPITWSRYNATQDARLSKYVPFYSEPKIVRGNFLQDFELPKHIGSRHDEETQSDVLYIGLWGIPHVPSGIQDTSD